MGNFIFWVKFPIINVFLRETPGSGLRQPGREGTRHTGFYSVHAAGREEPLIPAEPAGSGEADGVLPPAEPAAEPAEEPPAAEEPPMPDEPPIPDDPLMAGEPAPLPAMEEEGLTFRSRQPAAARQRASARQRAGAFIGAAICGGYSRSPVRVRRAARAARGAVSQRRMRGPRPTRFAPAASSAAASSGAKPPSAPVMRAMRLPQSGGASLRSGAPPPS